MGECNADEERQENEPISHISHHWRRDHVRASICRSWVFRRPGGRRHAPENGDYCPPISTVISPSKRKSSESLLTPPAPRRKPRPYCQKPQRLLIMGGWQSGQMQRTVTPSGKPYVGSNPTPPTTTLSQESAPPSKQKNLAVAAACNHDFLCAEHWPERFRTAFCPRKSAPRCPSRQRLVTDICRNAVGSARTTASLNRPSGRHSYGVTTRFAKKVGGSHLKSDLRLNWLIGPKAAQ